MSGVLLDPTARIYGPVTLGAGSIVEAGVVIGHPSAEHLRAVRNQLGSFRSVDELYGRTSVTPTIIGPGSTIRSGTVIYEGVTTGTGFDCGHHVVIREHVQVGDEVYVKNHSEIMRNVRIGARCRVAGVLADHTVIGSAVSTFGVLTHRYGRYISPVDRDANLREPSLLAAPSIADGAIIGRGAVVIGPCHIGEGAVVGANAVVNFDVAARSRVTGTVARTTPRT